MTEVHTLGLDIMTCHAWNQDKTGLLHFSFFINLYFAHFAIYCFII